MKTMPIPIQAACSQKRCVEILDMTSKLNPEIIASGIKIDRIQKYYAPEAICSKLPVRINKNLGGGYVYLRKVRVNNCKRPGFAGGDVVRFGLGNPRPVTRIIE